MTNRIQTSRFSATGQRPIISGLKSGALYTNTADMQLGVVNPTGQPLDLIAVTNFSTSATYNTGAYVLYSGKLYRANQTIPVGSFNTSQWNPLLSTADFSGDAPDTNYYVRQKGVWYPADSRYLQLTGGTGNGNYLFNVPNVQGFGINGYSNDPLIVTAPNGGLARIRYNNQYVREWAVGVNSNGNWSMFDMTANAERMWVDGSGGFGIENNLYVVGPATIGGAMSVNGAATVNGLFTVNNNAAIGASLTVYGNEVVSGNSNVGSLNINGDTYSTGNNVGFVNLAYGGFVIEAAGNNSDPLQIVVNQGNYARINYINANVAEWHVGVDNIGRFAWTGGSDLAILDGVGNFGIAGILCNINMNGPPPLKTFSGHVIQFDWTLDNNTYVAAYNIDGSGDQVICNALNFNSPDIIGGAAGPTGAAISCLEMSGQYWQAFLDYKSDARIKHDIAPTKIDALSALLATKVTEFTINDDAARWLTHGSNSVSAHVPIGIVAQDIEHIDGMVHQDVKKHEASPLPIDCRNVRIRPLDPYYIKAFQQLEARIAELEARLAEKV